MKGALTDVLLLNEAGQLVDRTGEFAPEFLTTPTDARDALLVDLDGDGWLDVIVCNTFGQQPVCYRNLGANLEGYWLGLRNESATRLPMLTIPDLQFCAVRGRRCHG